jgi:hypothetical protein
MTTSIKAAVFGDLTALFSARSRYRKPINYGLLGQVLKNELGVEKFDYNIWFTLFSDQNEGQKKFVQAIKDLGWSVEPVRPNSVRRDKPTDYRFDTRIAYEVGVSLDAYDKILIVSDSFELSAPLLRFVEESEDPVEVYLAFFSEHIDGRWWKILQDPTSKIKFIDLDRKLYEENAEEQ